MGSSRLEQLPAWGLALAAGGLLMAPAVKNLAGYATRGEMEATAGRVVKHGSYWQRGEPSKNRWGQQRYRFEYEYEAAGKQYRARRYSYCHIDQQAAGYRRTRPLQPVRVYYSIEQPENAVLDTCRPGWQVGYRLAIGAVPTAAAMGSVACGGFFNFLGRLRGQ